MLVVQVILVLAAIAGVSATPVKQRPAKTFYYFSFGDSYTTTGFDINGAQPAAGNPMGNPPLGTTYQYPLQQKGTFTGGINYVGYLTTKYNSTDVRSYNFAFPGACIDDSAPGCNSNAAPSFANQVNKYFEPRYTVNSPWKTWNGNNSIFSVFFGINDIDKTLSGSGSSGPGNADTVTQRLISSYLSLADNLYQQGGRRFLFIAVPPFARNPYIQTKPAATIAQYTTWINTFNYHLGIMIPKWQSKYTDVSVSTFDVWQLLTNVLDDPKKYGFPDATCTNNDGQSCVWWNSFHVGAKFNLLQAQHMQPAMNALGFDGSVPSTGYFER